MNRDKKNTIILYGFICVLFVLIYVRSAPFKMDEDNLIIFFQTYLDGMKSAGLIGTIWAGLSKLLPVDIMNFHSMYLYSRLMLIVYFILLLVLIINSIRLTKENVRNNTRYIAYAMIVLIGSMFCNSETVGSYEMHMAIMMLLSMNLLVINKGLYFIPLLSVIGILIHPSYMLCVIPIITILLFHNKKNSVIAALNIIVSSIGYVVSEVLAFTKNTPESSSLMPVYVDPIRHIISLLIYCILLIPYILVIININRNVITNSKGSTNIIRLQQYMWIIAAVQFLYKSNYGYTVYYILMYIIMLYIYMSVNGNETYIDSIDATISKVKENGIIGYIMLIYPILLIPMTRDYIINLCDRIWDLI